MKFHSILVMTLAALCISCINNPLDSKFEDNLKKSNPLKSIATKSHTLEHGDSLIIMNKIQKDVNHLMMNRIIYKDSVFILGIKREDTIAIGDSMNDYHMLQFAGIAVAVGNAEEQIKDIADIITEDCNNSGVGKALERIFWGI